MIYQFIGLLLITVLSGVEASARETIIPADNELTTYEKIELITTDGVNLTGHLAFPRKQFGPVPLVYILSSHNGSNRYGEVPANLSSSGNSELIYKQIEQSLIRAGMAVALVDKRGLRPTDQTFLQTDRDLTILAQADFVRLTQDALLALDHLLRHPRIQFSRVALLGHGDGALIAVQVAEQRSRQVSALIYLAPMSRSLNDTLRFQYIERNHRLFMVADANFDGFLDQLEMRVFSERTSPALLDIFIAADRNLNGRLSEGEWRSYWNTEMRAFLRLVWDDQIAWPHFISRHWYRQVLQSGDWLERHSRFCQRLIVFHGEVDDLISLEDSSRLVMTCDALRSPVRFFTYDSLGFGFSPRIGFRTWFNTSGPISNRVLSDLARELERRLFF